VSADERREAAVKTLVATSRSGGVAAASARLDALKTLQNIGHSQAEVRLARARALEGCSVEEIVEGLVESERGVAA